MRKFALIGYPLGHSFSQSYFTDKFAATGLTDCSYEKFAIESIDLLPQRLAENPELCGFNVTIPYKQQVIKYLDSLDDEAAQIGAVNCVRIRNGKLRGYNTDVYGFRSSLLDLLGEARPSALVLGTGGASKAVTFVLEGLRIDYVMVSRSKGEGRLTYDELTPDIMAHRRLVVNTTPLGTSPNTDASADIPYHLLTPDNYLFDLVYNPPITQFLKRGSEHGAHIMNGHKMLVGQAEKSWEIWNR